MVPIQFFEPAYIPTCSKHLQQQIDGDLAPQKELLYTAPSCGHHTNVEASGMDSQLLECSQYTSAYVILAVR